MQTKLDLLLNGELKSTIKHCWQREEQIIFAGIFLIGRHPPFTNGACRG